MEDTYKPSPLERMPGSWLRQLVRSIPCEHLITLFQCNKSLAKLVMQSVTEAFLQFVNMQPLTEQQTQTSITELLSERHVFNVVLRPAPYQPVPTQLAGRVKELRAFCEDDIISTCCRWDTMCNLRTLYLAAFNINTLDENLAELCATVQAGQLQQLRSFKLHLGSSCKGTIHNLERLVQALGPHSEELSSSPGPLLMNLHHFAALRSVSIERDGGDGDTYMQKMLEHPTLRKVTLGERWYWPLVLSLHRDYSQRTCNWETLTLHRSNLSMLLQLPISQVQHVRLVGYVSGFAAEDEQGHARIQRAAADMLKRHAEKFACEGSKERWELKPYFRMTDACEAMLPLLKRMPGVEALTLEQDSYPYKAGVLISFLQGVPESVKTVTCKGITSFETSKLWQSLPQHVTELSLERCAIGAAAAHKLVRNTPAHVSKLTMLAMNERHYDAWEAAGLGEAAPEHLQFQLEKPVTTVLWHP